MRAFPFLKNFVVTSLFGRRARLKTSEGYTSPKHCGIDLVGIDDKNVVASQSGVVTIASFGKGIGNYVWIETDEGFGNIYQHLEKIYVKVGQKVSIKEKIGLMGSTGKSTGPHLHFGVSTNKTYSKDGYYGNNWINPNDWFGFQDTSKLVGQTFSGSGYITGNPKYITPTNNTAASVSSNDNQTTTTDYNYLDSLIPSGEFYMIDNLKGIYSDWLYGRKYRIFVDIGNGKAFNVSELRCEFEIIKSAYLEANQSILTIYNLNPDDENKIIKEGQRIVIEAGYYGSQYGKIFEGNIIQPLRSKENGVDYKLTLVSMDSDRYATYGLIGVSLVAQQSSRDAVKALTTKAKYSSQAGFLTDMSIVYPRGKVMFGMAKDFLSQIAKSENATYYNEDGKVNIISAKDVDKNHILSFGPDTGLIGSPVQTEYGITCEVLLNPRVKINTLFHLDNKKIENYRYTTGNVVRSLDSQGIYRAIRITHTGDTRGNNWKTKIEAISQAGLLPGMVAGQSLYAW